MKKLMLAAVAAAAVGGAFADPMVYDYKASVKHLYLKEVKVKSDGETFIVYQKYQTSATLTGYLIMDADGVTSPTINTAHADSLNYYSNGFDYGRNRGFLVVRNNSLKGKDKALKTAKILPAVLDAKWIDTAFAKNHTASSGLAEGYLYVGGDAVAPVRQQLDLINKTVVGRKDADGAWAIPAVPVAGKKGEEGVIETPAVPGMVAAADYLWTSIYLFGQYNGPNWFPNILGYSPFGQFEYAWDANLPLTLQTGWTEFKEEGEVVGYLRDVTRTLDNPVYINNYYHDTWMNGAGVGKWIKPADKDLGKRCCGLKPTKLQYDRILDTLTGGLKGGIFLCTENGIDAEGDWYQWWDGYAWEDQFNTARVYGTALFARDSWQNDLWQDGFIELEVTDVVYGTWTIKYNSKFLAEGGKGKEYTAWLKPDGPYTYAWGAGNYTLVDKALWVAIYGAAYALDKNVNFWTNREIYEYEDSERFEVPMLTPKFALYYRLLAYTPIN